MSEIIDKWDLGLGDVSMRALTKSKSTFNFLDDVFLKCI